MRSPTVLRPMDESVQMDTKVCVESQPTSLSPLRNLSKSNGKSSTRSSKQSKLSSNGSFSRHSSSRKRNRSESSELSDSERETGPSTSNASSSSSGSGTEARKFKRRRRSTHIVSCSGTNESSSDFSVSEAEDTSRKHKSSGSREKKSVHRKGKIERKSKPKEKRHRQSGSSRDKDADRLPKKSRDRERERERHKRKEKRSKHRKEGGKSRTKERVAEVVVSPEEDAGVLVKPNFSRTQLQEEGIKGESSIGDPNLHAIGVLKFSQQVTMDAQEQQKALIRRNAELAKARLASGELQRVRDEQAEMQRLYGAVDWRAKKKLRSEKRRLERTIAAGNKLANMEEREVARMDAFRVALGLPTAEAQRQAEWRAEATRALAEQEAILKESPPISSSARPPKHSVIGPRLPHR